MTRFEDLLHHLIDTFTHGALAGMPGGAGPAALAVTELTLDLPVETRIDRDGDLLMSLPRGQLATGFELPLGRLRLHCAEPSS